MIEAEQPDVACPICAKHRGEGPLAGPKVFEDEHVVVSHRPVGEDATAFLGYLFVESRRHVPFLDGLTDTEASAITRTGSLGRKRVRCRWRAMWAHDVSLVP